MGRGVKALVKLLNSNLSTLRVLKDQCAFSVGVFSQWVRWVEHDGVMSTDIKGSLLRKRDFPENDEPLRKVAETMYLAYTATDTAEHKSVPQKRVYLPSTPVRHNQEPIPQPNRSLSPNPSSQPQSLVILPLQDTPPFSRTPSLSPRMSTPHQAPDFPLHRPSSQTQQQASRALRHRVRFEFRLCIHVEVFRVVEKAG